MNFKLEKFMNTQFQARTYFYHLPEFGDWFEYSDTVQKAVSEFQKIKDQFPVKESQWPDVSILHGLITKTTHKEKLVDVLGLAVCDEIADLKIGFTVRGLTGHEMGIAKNEAIPNLWKAFENLSSGISSKIKDAIQEVLGLNDPVLVAKSLYMFKQGIVSPEIPEHERLQFAVKVCQVQPSDFFQIVDKIGELTGLGQQALG